jgi:hypothetical protein
MPPLVPWIVSVNVPPVTPLAAVSVNALLPPGEMLVGANAAAIPFGSPVIDTLTADLNPLSATADTATLTKPPAVTAVLEGFAVSVKLGTTMVSARV